MTHFKVRLITGIWVAQFIMYLTPDIGSSQILWDLWSLALCWAPFSVGNLLEIRSLSLSVSSPTPHTCVLTLLNI